MGRDGNDRRIRTWGTETFEAISRWLSQTIAPHTTLKVETMQPHDDDALLTPSEVAAMFRVNPKTVTRWARAGKISAIRTLGGHRRFRASEIRTFLEQVEDSERI